MNTEEQLLVLLGMTEQQQKTITAAVEELKKQTASLNGIAPELQKAVQAAIVTALARSMGDVAQRSPECRQSVRRPRYSEPKRCSGRRQPSRSEAKLRCCRLWQALVNACQCFSGHRFFCASDGGPCRRLVGTLRAGEPESRKGGYARKHSPP